MCYTTFMISVVLASLLVSATNLASRVSSSAIGLSSKVVSSTTNLVSVLPSVTNLNINTDKFHSALRADPPILSSFLPNHELLKRQPDTFPFHYFYRKGSLGAYKRVCVAPVDLKHLRESSAWADLDKKMSGQFGNNVAALCDFMHAAYRQAFEDDPSGRFSVTDEKGRSDTLVIEPALIAVVPSKAELQAAGIVASALVFPGLGAVSSVASAGSIAVECRIRDARTDEIVAMYADV